MRMHVRLYGRPGCQLCEEAGELLEKMSGEFDFWIERVDIEEDPALKERLRNQVPVVTVDGGNRIALRITEDRLRRAFRRAGQRREPS